MPIETYEFESGTRYFWVCPVCSEGTAAVQGTGCRRCRARQAPRMPVRASRRDRVAFVLGQSAPDRGTVVGWVRPQRLCGRPPADAATATPGAFYRWKSCPGLQVHSARAHSGQSVRPCPPSGEWSAASRIAWTIAVSGFFVMASPCTSMMRSHSGRASPSRAPIADVSLPALSTALRLRAASGPSGHSGLAVMRIVPNGLGHGAPAGRPCCPKTWLEFR